MDDEILTDIPVVLSQPGCRPCAGVKSWLTNNGIDFVEKDVTQDTEALDTMIALGYKGTPVIIAGDQHWQGVDMDKMASLKP